MVEHPHVLEQPELVQTLITIVTVVTIAKEVAMLDVLFLATGVKHLPVRKVSHVYTITGFGHIILYFLSYIPNATCMHWYIGGLYIILESTC